MSLKDDKEGLIKDCAEVGYEIEFDEKTFEYSFVIRGLESKSFVAGSCVNLINRNDGIFCGAKARIVEGEAVAEITGFLRKGVRK